PLAQQLCQLRRTQLPRGAVGHQPEPASLEAQRHSDDAQQQQRPHHHAAARHESQQTVGKAGEHGGMSWAANRPRPGGNCQVADSSSSFIAWATIWSASRPQYFITSSGSRPLLGRRLTYICRTLNPPPSALTASAIALPMPPP